MLPNKKRVLSLVLSVLMLLALLPEFQFPAAAASSYPSDEYGGHLDMGECGANASWMFCTDGTLVIYGTGSTDSYTQYAPVPWAAYQSQITAVDIQSGITGIGSYAFKNCENLISVKIAGSLTGIESYAFYECTGLTDIYITDLRAWCEISYGYYAEPMRYAQNLYLNNEPLTDLVIPDGVTCVPNYAFQNCKSLTSVTLPDSVTEIGAFAFAGCSNLPSITLPKTVKRIGNSAFSDCTSLMDVYISDLRAWCEINFGLKATPMEVAQNLYLNNELLTEVTIPDDLYSIGRFTFQNCKSLTRVTFPDTVMSIGDSAFRGCTGLTEITLPVNLKTLDQSAFRECTGLTSITLPDGLTKIGDYTFSRCSSLESITIPETVVSIGEYAFSRCSSLKQITIPDSVTSVEYYTFSQCTALTSVTLSSGLTKLPYAMFNECSSLTDVTIPESVTYLDGFMFYECSSLASITIPESVTTIGIDLFWGCSSLTEVNLPESITYLPGGMFRDCSSLTDITIPESVVSISDSVFYGCSSLTSIAIPKSVTTMGSSVFDDCDNLEKVIFLGSAPTFDSKCFTGAITTAYNSCLDPTWTEDVKQRYGGVVTWKGHMLGEYVDNQDANCLCDGTVTAQCQECDFEETLTVENSATGHSFDDNDLCTDCGSGIAPIIYMTAPYGYGWYGMAIEVYANDELQLSATVPSGSSKQVECSYFPGTTYVFVWTTDGSYTDGTFEIRWKGELLAAGDCWDCTKGQILYTLESPCEHHYEASVTPPACTDAGFTTYICAQCGDTYTADQTPAIGHSFENGTCSVCGAADPNYVKPVVQPVLTLQSPTLEFKDMICINAFYTAENIENVVQMGMITYSSKVDVWNVETAEHVIPGTTYDVNTGLYIAHSQGIHAKYLGDTVYLACYAELTDGSYVYTKLAPYSPVQYAVNQLENSGDMKLKQLCAAMLNYGAEAQLFFGHNVGSLANASLTDEQKALPESYCGDMVDAVPSASEEKQGVFFNNKGFTKRYPAVSFEDAFCINYFFTPVYVPVDGITLYYWNEADYNVADVLTVDNATGSFQLEGSGIGEYRGDIVGISAKNLSDVIYVAAVYSDGTATWTSGVLGYSIGAYCSSQVSKGTAVAALAEATAVYGYHAKQYFS